MKRLFAAATAFVTVVYRRLRDPELFLVAKWLSDETITEVVGDFILRRVNGVILMKSTFMDLTPTRPLSDNMMNIVLALLERRERRIMQSYHDVHFSASEYVPRQISYYYGPTWLQYFQDGGLADWSNTYHVYVTVMLERRWSLLVLDCSARTIYLVDSHIGRENPAALSDAIQNSLAYYVAVMTHISAKAALPPVGRSWSWKVYPHNYVDPIQNDYDSGIFVFACLYFLSAGCPLGFNSICDMEIFRRHLAYWTCVGDLPY